MRDLERTWNRKFNYPWTFFNDEPFTDDFKKLTQAETKAECRYGMSCWIRPSPSCFFSRLTDSAEQVPKEHWDVPEWISMDLFHESAEILKESKIQYADVISYRQMCRWNSGMFYRHPALENIRYYWRVEPKVQFFCNIDYDVFRFMHDNNKTYGFTINLYDAPESIPTLWPETQRFLAAHPDYVHENNMMEWLVDAKKRPDRTDKANGYSTCHFWSNFEIADLDFFRSEIYEEYFNHLDRAGGFFYERWGDAPVHSIALGLFADASKVHWCVASQQSLSSRYVFDSCSP
jgi:mannosyltransferase